MLKAILVLLISIYSISLAAIPAKRERYTLTLADGTKIEATSMGDEVMHFYMTDDGRYLRCDSNGIASFVDHDTLYARWQARAEKRQAARARKNSARRAQRRAGQNPMTGSRRGLVILVDFPDKPFYYSKADFNGLFNVEGYSDNINTGSVHDYFLDASYGQFNFSFDIAGPVTMSNNLSYYGGNNNNGDDKHPAIMVAEAIQLIKDEVDFSKYDWDGDGEVENIFIVHSGYDEAQTSRNSDIWSHAWTLSEAKDEGDGDGPITIDGILIDSYATSSELDGKSGLTFTGIGTPCHEFSHCFGLPDFYDTAGSCFGMYSWDLLDYGSYNGGGGTPAGFTSYERMFCGWLEPIELTEPVTVQDMPALTSEPTAYILRNSGKHDEYYLLENRQQEGWDKYISGHGLLILHVDYDSQAWHENTVNTIRSHQRMTIIPADNFLSKFGMAGDPWPGTSGQTELSENSTPAATLYNTNAEGDKLMHHSITEIAESDDGLISFIFDEEAMGIEEIGSSKGKMGNGEEIEKSENINCPIARCYDLSGRIANKATKKGVYIHEGKKIVMP